jgi:hypothetical protein
MTTLISTCNTKREFRDRVQSGVNVTMFDPYTNAQVSLRDVQDNTGHSFTVTNRKRSWYASVAVRPERKLVVK